MSLTKKTAYALRALYQISLSDPEKPVNRKTIAEKQKISGHFLERILVDLLGAKITRSIRGPGGGFILNRDPKHISVWDVFTAVENKQHLYSKCNLINHEKCELSRRCRIKYIWPKINRDMKASLSSISLQDIRQKGSRRRESHAR